MYTNQMTTDFDVLYKAYASRIQAKCFSILGDEESARDITQEAFLKLLEKIQTFRGDSKLSTWLYSIAINMSLDSVRKSTKNQSSRLTENYDREEEIDWSDEEQFERYEQCFNKLDPVDKELLSLKYKENKSIEELASIYNTGQSAIKMRLKRAKAKAQKTLHS